MKSDDVQIIYRRILIRFDFSVVSQTDYTNLETCAKNAIKEKQQFVRLEMTKEELLEMFKVS